MGFISIKYNECGASPARMRDLDAQALQLRLVVAPYVELHQSLHDARGVFGRAARRRTPPPGGQLHRSPSNVVGTFDVWTDITHDDDVPYRGAYST